MDGKQASVKDEQLPVAWVSLTDFYLNHRRHISSQMLIWFNAWLLEGEALGWVHVKVILGDLSAGGISLILVSPYSHQGSFPTGGETALSAVTPASPNTHAHKCRKDRCPALWARLLCRCPLIRVLGKGVQTGTPQWCSQQTLFLATYPRQKEERPFRRFHSY